MLGAALLWGSAAARPDEKSQPKSFEAGLVPLFDATASELVKPQGPFAKAFIDYITTVGQLGTDETLSDEERLSRAHIIELSRLALQAEMDQLKQNVVALDGELRLGKDQQQLYAQQGLYGEITKSFAEMSEKVAAAHAREIMRIAVFAGGAQVDKDQMMAAVAKVAGANRMLMWNAKHPQLAEYALMAASACVVGGIVVAVVKNRQPLTQKLKDWYTQLAFGPVGKSLSLYDNPVIDALFTLPQSYVDPKRTWEVKPWHVGVSFGLLGTGAVVGGAIAVHRMRGGHMEPYRAQGSPTRYQRIAGRDPQSASDDND